MKTITVNFDNILGKIKTVTQIIAVSAAILEPILYTIIKFDRFEWLMKFPPITFVMTVVMSIFTILSGINYLKGAWKYLDPEK